MRQVEIKGPSLSKQLFGGTASLLSAATVVLFLTYFLLAVGDLFLQKLVAVLPQFKDKKTAVSIARETEAQISVYLFTSTLINIVAALVTFDSVSRALLVPAVFFGINLIEGNLVTPMILGRRMRLNTVALFIGFIFWWYIWGVPGAILAVPIMAALKIVCDHIESLTPIGEFLGT